MNMLVIAALIAADLVVVAIVFRLFKKHRAPEDLLEDLREERNALKHMQAEVRSEIADVHTENKKILERARQIAYARPPLGSLRE